MSYHLTNAIIGIAVLVSYIIASHVFVTNMNSMTPAEISDGLFSMSIMTTLSYLLRRGVK